MISAKLLREQIDRLRFCNYYPSANPAPYVAEITRVIVRAKNDLVVVAVIDDWLADNRERPTVADINHLVAEHNGKLMESAPVYPKPEPWSDEELAWRADLVAKFRKKIPMLPRKQRDISGLLP